MLPLAAVLAALLPAVAGCTSNEFTRLGMPVPATSQGQVTVTLWQGSWVAAFAVGLVVWGMIIWAIIFHRKNRAGASQEPPAQVRYNLPIEILYTVVPFIMVGVLFYFTARDENKINSLSARPDVVVDVTGFQWSWEFQYPQYPVKNSAHGVTEVGPMWNGEVGPGSNCQVASTAGVSGAESCQLPLLEIPAHKTVRFNLTSNDVVHSFWILPFDFKRDVIPDHPNHFDVYPTATLYSGPDTIGRCSELCGLYHSRMLFRIKIVTPAQFTAWITNQQAKENASGGTQ